MAACMPAMHQAVAVICTIASIITLGNALIVTPTPASVCLECATTAESFFIDPHEYVPAQDSTGYTREFIPRHPSSSIGLHTRPSPEVITNWTWAAIDASGVDHLPGYGERNGPGQASRAVAMTTIAIYDSVLSILGGYEPYCLPASEISAHPQASMSAAVATAAHRVLVHLFTKQIATFDAKLQAALAAIPAGAAKTEGVAVGTAAADCIITLRSNDNSSIPEPNLGTGPREYNPPPGPLKWRQDPISLKPKAIGAYWSSVTPFILDSASQYRLRAPPSPDSAEFARMYQEVYDLGSLNSTSRTAEQLEIGIYWAYDGLPSLCAPPRLYMQLAMSLAYQQPMCLHAVEWARLVTATAVIMADAAIAAWDSKFYHNLARPITGIRLNDDPVWGDHNPATIADPNWVPLGAPASNSNGPDFTPPFPAYPSGHATFGGAVFQTFRHIFGTDNIPFSFVSDEFNGITKDANGNARPLKSRSFPNLSAAELENGQSRVYLGIHWACDCDDGIELGRKIADLAFQRKFGHRLLDLEL